MQNKTYSDLYALIVALSGNSSFTTAEQTKILAMANRRLYQAYRSSEVWPRYIVGAEARPATDGVISREYDATAGIRTVSAATRAADVVTIVTTADVDFVDGMYVTVSGLSGSVTVNGTHQVTVTDTDTFTIELDTTDTSSETYTGTGTITPVAVSDIDAFNRVWLSDPYSTQSATECEFYVDSEGAHVINNWSDADGFWVGYKKEWGGPYLSSATDIPLEHFYYAAHATYADYLRMDQQLDKAMAEESAAQQYLLLEIDRVESEKNNNNLRRRIMSHSISQSR